MPASSADAPSPGPEVPGPVGGYRNAPVTAPGFDSPAPNIPGPPDVSGAVSVDTTLLDKAAVVAGEAAGEAASSARRVDDAVGRSGSTPWGDDPGLGQSFGSVFDEPRQALVEAMQTLREVLRDLAEALQQTSRTFTDTENEAVTAAQSLAARISRDAM